MIIKTKEFQAVAGAILFAVDGGASNLELHVKDGSLRLNVSGPEYFVSKTFPLEVPEEFKAVVDGQLFLNLISGITSEVFELKTKDNTVQVKVGKSIYKLPMIYDKDELLTLAPIILSNVTVTMPISNDILQSILNVNSKELLKVKNIDVSELQKQYYIDETGCFTFTTGACFNAFTLEKPVKLLLNDRIVKLFKLFKTDVSFFYGIDSLSDTTLQTKVVFTTPDTYLAAIINSNDVLLNKIQGPCAATKNFIKDTYSNHLVVSSTILNAAINRLMLFYKNSSTTKLTNIPITITINPNEIIIADTLENKEVVEIDASSYTEAGYTLTISLNDLKLVLDSCKGEHITVDCGNHRAVVITRGNISNLIPEYKR